MLTSFPHRSLLALLFHGIEIERVFSPEAQLAAMVRFELALARALEAVEIAPPGTAAACARGSEDFVSQASLEVVSEGAVASGNVAIPFVKALIDAVRSRAGSAADYIHFGATSQDLLDTVLVLQLGCCFAILDTQLKRIIAALALLTRQHRGTVLAGRTWLQQGPPVTFGLKTAQWLSALLRHQQRLSALRDRVCVLQFGGAVGTLASLSSRGQAVSLALARELDLRAPTVPWHTQRDTFADVATVLALLDGTLGKIARDLSLMVQNEVGEVSIEASPGAGGSSTMPHKRNPVGLAVILAAATRAPGLASTMLSAMPQEHERGLGGWHAEWETLPELCKLTCGAAEAMANTLAQLQVHPDAMQRNLNTLRGVTMAEQVTMCLAEHIGRPAAHQLMELASRAALQQGRNLQEVLEEDRAVMQHLSLEALTQALDPAAYLGSTQVFIDQVLDEAAHHNLEVVHDAHP